MSSSFIPYVRVSTDRQGASGLGLEAQQAAIAAFLRPGDSLASEAFVEVESGKRADRPQLAAALRLCRETGATLLIARLDRLARSVLFISRLMDEGVEFVACDMPSATPFMLHIYAAVAEEEARAISKRTKAALAAAKARGVKLGGDRGYRPLVGPDAVASARVRIAAADRAARRVAAAVALVRSEAVAWLSLDGLARALGERGVPAPRGGAWTATAVRRALLRAGAVLPAACRAEATAEVASV